MNLQLAGRVARKQNRSSQSSHFEIDFSQKGGGKTIFHRSERFFTRQTDRAESKTSEP
jgi:hypothetical protein